MRRKRAQLAEAPKTSLASTEGHEFHERARIAPTDGFSVTEFVRIRSIRFTETERWSLWLGADFPQPLGSRNGAAALLRILQWPGKHCPRA